MTQPTIEQFLSNELWSLVRSLMCHGISINDDYHHNKRFGSYEEYSARIDEAARERAAEIEARIRTALTAQSANTLPLDEVPEGWELAFISHGKFGDGATFSAQIRRIVSHTIRYAYGATPAEALRAAIAKVEAKS